jgi:hypothetical protein
VVEEIGEDSDSIDFRREEIIGSLGAGDIGEARAGTGEQYAVDAGLA